MESETIDQKVARLEAELVEAQKIKKVEDEKKQKQQAEKEAKDQKAWVKKIAGDEEKYLALLSEFNSMHKGIIRMISVEGREIFDKMAELSTKIAEIYDEHQRICTEKKEPVQFEKADLFGLFYGGYTGFVSRSVDQLKRGYRFPDGESFSLYK